MIQTASTPNPLTETKKCVQCGHEVAEKFCGHCGQGFPTKRITVHSILHEVFHFFTHIDKGLPFTLRELALRPGHMQREFISGKRAKHQKPFSAFFLTVTFTALAFYWINKLVYQLYQTGETEEINFFQHYMVITHALLVPVYAGILWIFFKGNGFNYAEALVLQLYTFSEILIIVSLIQLLKFVWPSIETRYLELPIILFYTIITNLNFFSHSKRWAVLVKTILATSLIFAIASLSQDVLVKWFAK